MKKIITILCIAVIVLLVVFNMSNIMRIIYKLEFSEYVHKYSLQYSVDPFMIYSIIKAESNFEIGATSNRGAAGLMQLMDNTAREICKNEVLNYESGSTLYNPEKNIMLGTKYFAELKDVYKNDNVALAAYNAGRGNVNKWLEQGIIKADGSDIENIPFKETNTYVRKILKNYKIYRKLYS